MLLACRTLPGFSLEQELQVVQVPRPAKLLNPVALKPLGRAVCCRHVGCAPAQRSIINF